MACLLSASLLSIQPLPVVADAPAIAEQSAEDQLLLQRMQALWSTRRDEIVTADIHYRQMWGETSSGLSPEAVAKLMAEHDLAADPDQLGPLVTALLGETPRIDPPWLVSRLVVEGESVRDEHGEFCLIRHDDLELIHDGDNTQTGVYPRGQSRRLIAGLKDFRLIPPESASTAIYMRDGGSDETPRFRTTTGDALVSFDPASGLVTNRQDLDPQSGALQRERWYWGLVQHADGVVFPTAMAEVRFTAGKLSRYRLRVVESAAFNEPVAPELFQSALPQGGTVVDYRSPEQFGYHQPSETADLASTLGPPGQPEPPLPAATAQPASTGITWLLALNGLVLTSLGIYFWRRDRRRMEKLAKDSPSNTSNR